MLFFSYKLSWERYLCFFGDAPTPVSYMSRFWLDLIWLLFWITNFLSISFSELVKFIGFNYFSEAKPLITDLFLGDSILLFISCLWYRVEVTHL